MKSSLPGYLDYSKAYDDRPATQPQPTTRGNPVRLSKARVWLQIVTLTLLAELAFLVYQIMWIYPVTSDYVAHAIEHETDITTDPWSTRLSAMVDYYNAITMQLANDPGIGKLLIAGNDAALRAREESLRQAFPEALNVQLLLPGIASVNMDSSPPLSYAALDQIRQSENSTQVPLMEVHLFDSPQQHVNIIRRVTDPASNGVAGHVMLSLPYEILQKILDDLGYVHGYIELQQVGAIGDPIVVAAQGDIKNREDDAERVISIAGSRWQLAYWLPVSNPVYLFSINVWVLCTLLLIVLVSMYPIIAKFHRLIHDTVTASGSYAASQADQSDEVLPRD